MAITWKKVAFEADVITKAFMAAKGDLISASDNDTPLILPVGANDLVLTAASGEATGLKWAASGDVSAAAALTDNYLVRGDGGVKGIQVSTIVVDDDGIMLNPSQPAFSAYVTSDQTDVTGDSTIYLLNTAIWTELFDQNNDLSDGVFTAPVTGKYHLSGGLYIANVGAAHTDTKIYILTSNNNYLLTYENSYPVISSNHTVITFNCIADMDANDTAYLRIAVTGGTKVVYVKASHTRFMGSLIC